jgi:undecaprenyl-diphosphatase
MAEVGAERRNRLRRISDFVLAEAGILLAIAVACGLVLAFLGLADEVAEGETQAFDDAVLLAFRTPGNPDDLLGPPWAEEMVRDVTALGSFACLGILVTIVVGGLLLAKMRGAALLVLVSVLSGTAISTLLKLGYSRPRPEIAHGMREFTASFPSGHAMLSAITFLTLGALLARLAPNRRRKVYAMGVAILLTLMVGVSRIYLGVHFPSDVLAGWCLGAAWALLCSAVALYLQKRGAVEAPRPEGNDAEAPRA